LAILLVRAVLVEIPAILFQNILKIAQKGLLPRHGYGHVIFHCVEAAQNDIEEGHGHQQLGMQFVDYGGETATGLIEEKEAPLQRRGLGSLVSLVYRVVPDLPRVVSVSRSRALRRR
jgi:hypothetical protein